MMKRITFLATTLVTPFAIHAMEPSTYALSDAITIHKKSVDKLCAQTCVMLQNFPINNKNSAQYLVSIIEQTDCLKQAKITEKEIGFFLFKQHQKQSFGDTIKNSLFYRDAISPFYATIFFERLANYNQSLIKDKQTSPNVPQILAHWKNQKLNRIATNCTMFGVTIPESTVAEKTIQAQASVAVTAFDQLLLHIDKILHEDPRDIKIAAQLVYHNELKNKSTPPLLQNQSDTTETP